MYDTRSRLDERYAPYVQAQEKEKIKAALQEADDEGDEGGGKPVQRDAKGREVLAPEEKARRDEKARKAAAEVRGVLLCVCAGCRRTTRRKRRCAASASSAGCPCAAPRTRREPNARVAAMTVSAPSELYSPSSFG